MLFKCKSNIENTVSIQLNTPHAIVKMRTTVNSLDGNKYR